MVALGNDGVQLRIGDVLYAMQKRWKAVLVATSMGFLLGLIVTAFLLIQNAQPKYVVKGSFSVATRPLEGFFLYGLESPTQNDFTMSEEMVEAVLYILQGDDVYRQSLRHIEVLGVSIADLKNAVVLDQVNSTQIIEMTVTWTNVAEAKNIWNAIITAGNEKLPESLMMGSLHVINEPVEIQTTVSSLRRSLWLVLAVLGFVGGTLYAIIELLLNQTIINLNDVEPFFDMEMLGSVPYNQEYYSRSSILVQNGKGIEIEESFSMAAYILRNRLGIKDRHHCFYVTSSMHGEGRSTVAANLAIQLSDMGQRTLLVDLDMRNPSLGSLFFESVDYNHTLNALYRGHVKEGEAITMVTGYLDILPLVLESDAIMLDGVIMELIIGLKDKYDYVVIDAPPVGKESDTLSINQITNMVLFVIGFDMAKTSDIQVTLNKLDKSGAQIIGCIVNSVANGNMIGQRAEAIKTKKPTRATITADEETFVNASASNDMIEGLNASGMMSLENMRLQDEKQKKKRGLFSKKGKKRANNKGEVVEEKLDENIEETQPVIVKNVFNDLMSDESNNKPATSSDVDVIQSLIKMGLEGDWDSGEKKEEVTEE